jgi:hypothetical protein
VQALRWPAVNAGAHIAAGPVESINTDGLSSAASQKSQLGCSLLRGALLPADNPLLKLFHRIA